MKKTILAALLLVSASSFGQMKSSGMVTINNQGQGAQYLTITGSAAKALFEEASINSDEVTHYDEGVSAVYKNDLACIVKKTKKSSQYSCSILLQNGKSVTAPRG